MFKVDVSSTTEPLKRLNYDIKILINNILREFFLIYKDGDLFLCTCPRITLLLTMNSDTN